MKKEKKYKLNFNKLVIKIKITLKNIFINILNFENLNYIFYSSSMGLSKIYGPKKSSPLSTQVVIKNIITKIKEFNVKQLIIFIKGHSKQTNRLSSIEMFKNFKFKIQGIYDSLAQPHNGCRLRKYRRDRRNVTLY